MKTHPTRTIGELFNAAYFPGHSLGRRLRVRKTPFLLLIADDLIVSRARIFAGKSEVVAAAGNVEHERLVYLVDKSFGNSADTNGRDLANPDGQSPTAAAPILIEQKKELEQAHLILAAPWPDAKDDDRYAGSLLASVIGGGTSSRLWQTIREERGLAYSVGAGGSTFSDVGVFTIYAGTSPEHLNQVLDLSLVEMRRVVNECVPDEELKLVKDQALSSILLGLESSSARVSALSRQEIIHGRRITPEETMEKIEAVSAEDLQRVAREYFTSEALALGALGNLNGFRVDRSRLKI